MRKIIIVGICLTLASCLSESGVEPGNSSTFIRYYNGGNNDEAVGLEQTPADGGFIILATTRIQKAEAEVPRFKIKLIKTDKMGNPLWISLFPAVDDATKDYSASSIQITASGGYVVTGEEINQGAPDNDSDDTSKILLFTVNADGSENQSSSFGTGSLVKGRAVAVNGSGNYLVLSTSGKETMYLNEIDKTTFAPIGTTTILYEAGQTVLTRRLLLDGAGKALWAGEVTKNGLTGIRMIRTIPNNANADFDFLFTSPPFKERSKDFCQFGQQYAIIGTTDQKVDTTLPPTDSDILFKRVSQSGEVLSTMSFSFDNPNTAGLNEDKQDDIGNSISATQDGGAILLSTVSSVALGPAGRGETDFYLIKINAFGGQEWVSSFGSKFTDEGVAVRQASDGGYVTLGTTSQGSLKIITLMKTDKNGKID